MTSLKMTPDSSLVPSSGMKRPAPIENRNVKQRRRREKVVDPCPMETVLPPCRICEEKSTGLHYGVNTCEACKSFYRRTKRKKVVDYLCKCTTEEKESWKRGPFKNGCPSCRYERCLEVGMSKDAMKVGRYSLKHRTSNILEVKTLEAQQQHRKSLDNLLDVVVLDAVSDQNTGSRSEDSPLSAGDVRSSSSSSSNSSDSTVSTTVNTSPNPGKPQEMDLDNNYMNSGMSLQEVQQTISVLTKAQEECSHIHFDHDELKRRHEEYLERYQLKTHIFGKMKPLSWKMFQEIYSSTGIDVDERLSHIVPAVEHFHSKILEYVKFSKIIPGFKQLCLDDQADLIKASRVENAIFGCYRNTFQSLDKAKQVLVTPWGEQFHLDEFSKVLPVNIVLERHRFAERLCSLDLTTEEDAVLRALAIVSPDRCDLREPEKAGVLHEKLVTCLLHLVNTRPGGPGTRLYKIMATLTHLRDLTESEIEKSKEFLLDMPLLAAEKNFSSNGQNSLLREFFG